MKSRFFPYLFFLIIFINLNSCYLLWNEPEPPPLGEINTTIQLKSDTQYSRLIHYKQAEKLRIESDSAWQDQFAYFLFSNSRDNSVSMSISSRTTLSENNLNQPKIVEPGFLRSIEKKLKSLQPNLNESRSGDSPVTVISDSLYDEQNFYVYPSSSENGEGEQSILATCRLVRQQPASDSFNGERPISLSIWVANSEWGLLGDKINQDMVDALANHFLQSGPANDIYDWTSNIYGAEWGTVPPADENLYGIDFIPDSQNITLLLLDIDDDSEEVFGSRSGSGEFVAGYFFPKDNITGIYSGFRSNERVMFYLDAPALASSDRFSWKEDGAMQQRLYSTLSHEFQHMIYFYKKYLLTAANSQYSSNFDDTWYNEMLSLMTEDYLSEKMGISGHREIPAESDDGSSIPLENAFTSLPATFNSRPGDSLTIWENYYQDYATAYSFGAWLCRNYGGVKLLREIHQNNKLGMDSILSALASLGYTNLNNEDLLRQWGSAVLCSNQILELNNDTRGYVFNTGTWFESCVELPKNELRPAEYDDLYYKSGSINYFNYRNDSNYDFGPFFNYNADGPLAANSINFFSFPAFPGTETSRSFSFNAPLETTLFLAPQALPQ